MTSIRSLLFAASATLLVPPAFASSFDDYLPADCSPGDVGGRVAAKFAASPPGRFNEKYQPPIVIYLGGGAPGMGL